MKFSDVQMIERLNAIHCASSFEDDNANNDEDEELTSQTSLPSIRVYSVMTISMVGMNIMAVR